MSSPKSPNQMSARERAVQLQNEYKASRKDWKKKSSAFEGQTNSRFAVRKPSVDTFYDAPQNTIAETTGKKAPSAWARRSDPQRPPTTPPLCEQVSYLSDESLTSPQRQNGAASFKSSSPKYDDAKPLPAGQQVLSDSSVALSPKKVFGKGLGGLATKSSRFEERKSSTTDVIYAPENGMIVAEIAQAKGKGAAWSKDKTVQRPSVKAQTDVIYDVNPPVSPYRNRAAFADTAERFKEVKNDVPAPGDYTSPLISAGMLTN